MDDDLYRKILNILRILGFPDIIILCAGLLRKKHMIEKIKHFIQNRIKRFINISLFSAEFLLQEQINEQAFDADYVKRVLVNDRWLSNAETNEII